MYRERKEEKKIRKNNNKAGLLLQGPAILDGEPHISWMFCFVFKPRICYVLPTVTGTTVGHGRLLNREERESRFN